MRRSRKPVWGQRHRGFESHSLRHLLQIPQRTDRRTFLTRSIPCGELPEWTIGHDWKSCVPARVPWVRIPHSPPRTNLSPRVRGNHLAPPRPSLRIRSIPACAGEPSKRRAQSYRAQVYPRVCGGTQRRARPPGRVLGLSPPPPPPRVRGNHRFDLRRRKFPRSIPACAGEPETTTGQTAEAPVYPRVCGGT